jgi:hypothetical protein
MVARTGSKRNRIYTSTDGLIARAGRAHENPAAMTADATWVRMAKYIAEVLQKTPELTPIEAARAGKLLMRADMARLAKRSAAARQREPLDLDATGLADCGDQ